MSHLLGIELDQREITIVYFLVSENILTFEQQHYFHLYVYSTLGDKHTTFLMEELPPLRQFFEEPFVICELTDPSILTKNNNIILLTNEVFADYLADKQYMISDYLTLNEFLHFSKWLRDRTTKIISYPA